MSDLDRIKKALKGAVDKRKQSELNSRSEEIMTTVGQDLVSALSPVLKEIAGQAGGNNDGLVREMTSVITQAMREVKIEMPPIEIPDNSIDLEPILEAIRNIKIDVPQSAVNVPAPIVNIPKTVFPEFPKYPEEIGLRGIDKMKPLPVMMMDGNGKQFQFPMGASGGKGDFFTIKAFGQSSFAELQNADGRLKVSVETGGSGLTDSELRASALLVSQLSGASWSVTVNEVFGSVATDVINPDGRVKVELPSGASGLTDTELRASSVPVAQASGANWSVSVKEIFGSTITSDVLNADNRLRVSVETGGSGLTDSELRASALPVSQLSGANWSVSVVDIFGSTATNMITADNRIKVNTELEEALDTIDSTITATHPVIDTRAILFAENAGGDYGNIQRTNGGSLKVSVEDLETTVPVRQVSGAVNSVNVVTTVGLTNTELRASSVPVSQASGANWSTEVTNTVAVSGSLTSTGAYLLNGDGAYRGTIPVEATDLDIRDLVNASDSVRAYQLSGASWSVEATQSGTWNITTLTGITNTVATASVDSSGFQYSGSNPMPVGLAVALDATIDSISTYQASGANFSVFVTGSLDSMTAWEARTTNPTAKSNGADVRPKTDDLGRVLTRPVQVRDLTSTAYATLSNGTETTLFAGATSTYHDLIYVLASNNSTVAVGVDIRASVGGNIMMHLEVPANGVVGVSTPVPIPAGDVGATWTADLPDITGTTVYLSALFSKEI